MVKLNLNSNMQANQIKKNLQIAREELENNTTLKPQIKRILHYVLNYAEKYLCWPLSAWIIQAKRYIQVRDLFNLGVASTRSLDDEKNFYTQAQRLLGYSSETKSKLRARCLPAIKYHEVKLMHDLEKNEPSHQHAVNGIISATLGLGFMASFLSRHPYWLLASLLALAGKLTPPTPYMYSPSLFGQLVYGHANLRQWGQFFYAMIPIDFSSSSVWSTRLKPNSQDN